MRKVGRAMRSRSASARRCVVGGEGDGGRQAPARLRGRRSGRTAPRPAKPGRPRAATWWSSAPLFSSMPLEQRSSGLSQPRRRSRAPRACAGRASPPARRRRRRSSARFGVARMAGSSAMSWQERRDFRGAALTASTTSGSSAHSNVSRPPARRDLRQRGAPGAAADDADVHAFTPAPRTFSALSSSGQRARAGASSSSVSPSAKRSAPAQAIIAALSVHSQAGGTLKPRPSRLASSASAERIAVLAATPPATTSAGASLIAKREQGTIDQAVDHRLLEAGGDVGRHEVA